jgi:hypothetical protein
LFLIAVIAVGTFIFGVLAMVGIGVKKSLHDTSGNPPSQTNR